MFRVPSDPDRPTFDDTYKISFGRWFRSGAAERREWTRRRNAAARLAAENQLARIGSPGDPDPVIARCESVKLRRRTIEYGYDQQHLTGVTASIVPGEALSRRTTATRVIGGALLAGPAGAIVGAVAKKKTGGTQYLVITGPTFEWQIQVDRGDVTRARAFTARVNTAVKQLA